MSAANSPTKLGSPTVQGSGIYNLSHHSHPGQAFVTSEIRRNEFVRTGEIYAGSSSLDTRINCRPAPNPRGWSAPHIPKLEYDIFHGKKIGFDKVPRRHRRRTAQSARGPREQPRTSKQQSDAVSSSWGSLELRNVSSLSAQTTLQHSTPGSRSVDKSFDDISDLSNITDRQGSPGQSLRERRMWSAKSSGSATARSVSTAASPHRPRPPTAPAKAGASVGVPLARQRRKTTHPPIPPPPPKISDEDKVEMSVFCSLGPALPGNWSPLPELDDEVFYHPEEVYRKAEMVTGVKMPREHPSVAARKQQPKTQEEKEKESENEIRRANSGPMGMGQSMLKEQRAEEKEKQKRKRGKEKLVGLHVKKHELVKEETRVVFSQQYFHTKEQSEDSVKEKGIGHVVGWDADGLMTSVRWEDGTVEYCCTGFSGLHFLALFADPEHDAHAHQVNAIREEIKTYPHWFVDEDGVSKRPRTARVGRQKDADDTAKFVKRLEEQLGKETPGTIRYRRAVDRLDKAKLTLSQLLEDRAIMSGWITYKLGDHETKIAPSALAPTGLVKGKKLSMLEEVKRLVRRDAEKERRKQRAEEEAEQERRRLERRLLRKAKGAADKMAEHEEKENRKTLDPWSALITANKDQMDSILKETFTLFDLDQSGWIEWNEFEKAMIALGIDPDHSLFTTLIRTLDLDKNGHLDYQEFKNLAMSIIRERKKLKEKEKQTKHEEVERKRRQAAGLEVEDPKPTTTDLDSGDDDQDLATKLIKEAVHRSTLLARDLESEARLFRMDSHRVIDSTPGASPMAASLHNHSPESLDGHHTGHHHSLHAAHSKPRHPSPRRNTILHVPAAGPHHRGRPGMFETPAPPMQLREAEGIVRKQAKATQHAHAPHFHHVHHSGKTSPSDAVAQGALANYLLREHSGSSASNSGEAAAVSRTPSADANAEKSTFSRRTSSNRGTEQGNRSPKSSKSTAEKLYPVF